MIFKNVMLKSLIFSFKNKKIFRSNDVWTSWKTRLNVSIDRTQLFLLNIMFNKIVAKEYYQN